ncbi:MAG: hypothetical protein AAGM46_28175, partial [Cyanobacteria bacterium J06582_2]
IHEPYRSLLMRQISLKVHGLTPHSSTDRCPYELIKLGGIPSLFPSLKSDCTQKSELTVTRHCAGNLKKRRSFDEGNLVTVYDNFRKISYDAVVSEVLGTNNYIVESDNGSKHVSGDCMSSRAAHKPSREHPADAPLPPATAITDNIDDNIVIDDDNISSYSDNSEDLELPDTTFNDNLNNNNVNRNNRRGQRELNNLLPIQSLSRLRSGRN